VATEIQFYMDENVPAAVTNGLRLRGVDVLTSHEAGMLGANDEAQLELATSLERVLFTQDADLLALHRQGLVHAGLAYAPQWTPIGELVRGLLLIHDVLTPEEMRGRVEFI
jgi:hypothetical protein